MPVSKISVASHRSLGARGQPSPKRSGDLISACAPQHVAESTKEEMTMSDLHTTNPATLALHAGYRADPATSAVAVPIYQTTS